MSQISVNNLTFYYEGSSDNIFEEVSFQIDTDWKLGFIGRNGMGKTTFLNLLQNKYEYKGSIKSNEVFDYFPFIISPEQGKKPVIEVLEELKPDYELWKVCRELDELKVDADILYQAFHTLSNGEQTKVMLALLFSMDNHFLLIDEPTNHLDKEARLLVQDYLNSKKGFILVSHDRAFMDACVDHVLVLNRTSVVVERGNFSSWWENKSKQDAFELSENEKLKKEIRKLSASARQSGAWADKVESTKIGGGESRSELPVNNRAYVGEKSRKMQQRRKNLENRQKKALEEKKDLLKDVENVEQIKIIPLKHHKNLLVKGTDFGICYGTKEIFSHLNFELEQGERLALKGKNGCGKTSVLKYLLGQAPTTDMLVEGDLFTASNLKISYVSQDTKMLKGDLESYAKKYEIDYTLFLSLLHKLDFGRTQFEKEMSSFSEGQKKKVLIARSLCEQAHIYLWDEPLNFIDVFSRMQIEQLLLTYKPTMLFVEHDSIFSEKIATKTILFK